MTLYTFYQENDQVVYGTFAEGKPQFFYSGFASAEEAKKATFDLLVKYRVEQRKPNAQGIPAPITMIETEVRMSLIGEWSEIQ